MSKGLGWSVSCVVVGLDARPDRLPEPLKSRAAQSEDAAAEALLEFNREVIAATAPYVAAAKRRVYGVVGIERSATLGSRTGITSGRSTREVAPEV